MNQVNPFDFAGKVAVVTGGSGALCSAIARGLAACSASVVLVGRTQEKLDDVARAIAETGGTATGLAANVLDKESLLSLFEKVIDQFGRVDILVNGAGGAVKEATTGPDNPFFDLPEQAVRDCVDLNLMGTLLPCQVFGRELARRSGCILNVGSYGSIRPLSRQVAYSAAKAAVVNFTQWLAVHIGQEYGASVRVNAIVPGFFLTEQNRFLLTDDKTGELTERGRQILAHTPSGRFGTPEDLVGPVLLLLSDCSSFINGAVLTIDGGFSAFGGV